MSPGGSDVFADLTRRRVVDHGRVQTTGCRRGG
jgi:hypothetical protein